MLLIGLVEVGTLRTYKTLKQPMVASKDPKEAADSNNET